VKIIFLLNNLTGQKINQETDRSPVI